MGRVKEARRREETEMMMPPESTWRNWYTAIAMLVLKGSRGRVGWRQG